MPKARNTDCLATDFIYRLIKQRCNKKNILREAVQGHSVGQGGDS